MSTSRWRINSFVIGAVLGSMRWHMPFPADGPVLAHRTSARRSGGSAILATALTGIGPRGARTPPERRVAPAGRTGPETPRAGPTAAPAVKSVVGVTLEAALLHPAAAG